MDILALLKEVRPHLPYRMKERADWFITNLTLYLALPTLVQNQIERMPDSHQKRKELRSFLNEVLSTVQLEQSTTTKIQNRLGSV